MMKNALYVCALADPWLDVMKQLRDECLLEPKYVVNWRADRGEFHKSDLKGVFQQDVEEAWRGMGFPADIKPLSIDAAEYKSIAYYILIGIRMMDRLDPQGKSFSFRDREDFFIELIGRWLAIIQTYDIDIVIAPTVPHRVFDYALYVAVKMKEKKFITFHLIPLGSNTILIDDIDNLVLGKFEKTDQPLSNEMTERIASIRGSYEDGMPYYMKAHISKNQFFFLTKVKELAEKLTRIKNKAWNEIVYPNTYWVPKKGLPNYSRMGWFEYVKVSGLNLLRFYSNKSFYSNLVKQHQNRAYILVALHYQPEETSCPSAGFFGNQIQLLRFLDEMLPSDISILVKEHKAQFFKTTEGVASRDRNYYQKMANISQRVEFLHSSDDPFSLIDGAMAVATLTGTIGWESAIRGTPALIFGRTWYGSLPLVYRVESKAEFTLIWEEIISLDRNDLSKDFESAHLQIQSNFTNAIHYKAFWNNTDVDKESSVKNLVNSIKSYLVRNGS
ncbi:MAG: hypothetical protein ACI8Q1_000965 [Parvicella sp.]|jgi:hypothetical protein